MAYSKETKLGQVVDKMITEIPGLIAISIVDLKSGMSLASHSTQANFDPDIASAFNAEVVRQKQKAMSALGLTGEAVEDILITLSNQIHLLRLFGNGAYFIYVAANSREANLAIVRSVMKKYSSEISI
jgi:predicted regulator of Ras-like GTPase activity (Roadblock/LC7/MglB family)